MRAPKGFLKVQNFIESKNGSKDFMNCVRNSVRGDDFKQNWNAILSKNGLLPDDLLLPPAVLSMLTDTWERTAEGFLSILDITGLKSSESCL